MRVETCNMKVLLEAADSKFPVRLRWAGESIGGSYLLMPEIAQKFRRYVASLEMGGRVVTECLVHRRQEFLELVDRLS